MNQRIEIDWDSPEYNTSGSEALKELFDKKIPWWKDKIYYPVYRFFRYKFNPKVWYYIIKAFIQRGRRGWADSDCWNLDSYIVKLTRDALVRYQKDALGWPDDLYPTFTDYKNDIMQVIWGLDHYLRVVDMEETCSCCDKFCYATGCPIIRDTFEKMYRMWPSLWW
jgi:hypothetical protein